MAMQKVVVLGGGPDQTLLVKAFKRRQWEVIVIDYYEDPPAKPFCDHHYQESTYDEVMIEKIVRDEAADLVTTISTDQPLLFAARISEKLGLPFPISEETAAKITNKKLMKKVLSENKIPTASYFTVTEDDAVLADGRGLTFPLIVKPVDSSGSRGVQRVDTLQTLPDAVEAAFAFSHSHEVIVEEFICGTLLSVDAMVLNGEANVIMATDIHNATQPGKEALCVRNSYPSQISAVARSAVREVVQRVADAFGLVNTPLFIQMIVGGDAPYVVELSARVAGGSKPYFIKQVTGLDIVESYTNLLLNEDVNLTIVRSSDHLSLCYVYAHAGHLKSIGGIDELIATGDIENWIYYRKVNDKIREWRNTSDRVGAFLTRGPNESIIQSKIARAAALLVVHGKNGQDLKIPNPYT